MLDALRRFIQRRWEELTAGHPGSRFQDRYWHYQRSNGGRSLVGRGTTILVGSLIAVSGIVLMPAPGPGWATFFVGLALLAGEFLFVAKALDFVERKGHVHTKRVLSWWEGASKFARFGLLLFLGMISLVAACGVVLLLGPGLW